MAKRRKKSHHRSHRRRRVGAINTKGLSNDLMESAGFVVAHIAGGMMQRTATSVNPKLISLTQIAAGIMLKRHSHSPFMTGVAYGLQGSGAVGLAQEFRVISGIEDFMNGIDNQSYTEQSQLAEGRQNGIDNQYQMNGMDNMTILGQVG